jgi:hypothetical protein
MAISDVNLNRYRVQTDPMMYLEDVQIEIEVMLNEIHDGLLPPWPDESHSDVQEAALDLLVAMQRLRASTERKTAGDPGPSQEQRL